MAWVAAAVAGGSLVLGAYSANEQSKAARSAADSQSAATYAGIDEQRRQFDEIRKLLDPYVQAGNSALTGQRDLIGLGGQSAQRSAIDALQASPEFAALTQQGENAILSNASATGGLRGGNVQGALAQFRPQILAKLIEEQYGRLGGLTALGQNAAVGVGNAGMQTGANVSDLLQQAGAAQAGGALSAGKASAALANNVMGSVGLFGGLGGFGANYTKLFQGGF